MSNVNLTIGGRSFTIACASGEEDHVANLGRLIDAKAASAAGQTETRMLLFAALLLADEVYELRGQAGTAAPATEDGSQLAERLSGIARRIENLADLIETGLEGSPDNP